MTETTNPSIVELFSKENPKTYNILESAIVEFMGEKMTGLEFMDNHASQKTFVDYKNGLVQVRKDIQNGKFASGNLSDEDITKITKYFSWENVLFELLEKISGRTKASLLNKYQESKNPDLQAAKDAIMREYPVLIKGLNAKERMVEKFYAIKEVADYLKQFQFNMKNKHSGKHELSLNKNYFFPVVYCSQGGHAYFRYFDQVEAALKSVDITSEKEVANMMEKIFVPKIWNDCEYCENENPISFDHEAMQVVELTDDVCSFAEDDLSKMTVQVTTKGKFVITNDIRKLLNEKGDCRQKNNNYAIEHDINNSLNSFEGQKGNMQIYAELFNVGYIQAGNHGASIYKRSDEHIELMFYDEDNKAPDGELSLSLWAINVMDYDEALKYAPEEKWKKLIGDYSVVTVKPGTYEVNSFSNFEDDLYDEETESLSNAPIGDVKFLHD